MIPLKAFEGARAGFSEIPVDNSFEFNLWIPYLVGLVYLASGAYVFLLRREDRTGQAFTLFMASSALSIAGILDAFTTHRLIYLWMFSVVLTGGAVFDLALTFPQEVRWGTRYSYLRWLGYFPALLLAFVGLINLLRLPFSIAYWSAWRIALVVTALETVFFLISMAVRWFASSSPVAREQGRLTLWAVVLSFTPLSGWLFITSLGHQLVFSPVLLLPFSIFPVVMGFAILRYHLLDTDRLASRAVMYILMSGLAACGYALSVSGLSLIFGDLLQPGNPYLAGLMVFSLALLLNPLRVRLQQAVDTIFFRGQAIYRNRLETFSRELTQAVTMPSIISLLRRYAGQDLLPSQLHIFLYDLFREQYISTCDENGHVTTDIYFPENSPLVDLLKDQGKFALHGLSDYPGSLPVSLHADRARLALLKSELFISLPGQKRLNGWLAFGPRCSGEPYTNRDLNFLEALSQQASLAVERARVVADLEKRVQEMNVLTRVAQGTNFTIVFDDILELIYAQTFQVIPTRDFNVALYNQQGNYLYYVFCLENDERLIKRENCPIPEGQGLELEIIHNQHALVTDDYERACFAHGILPSVQGLYAWMGVPLNAGSETIGVITLGSRDPAVVYTQEQRELLQAIADQACGAIIKTRLLEETERRAHQLATLNEIGRGLTSTLEPKSLLIKILQNAIEILNCQAGSLFLVDQQTEELVFEVVLGPVASDLVGKRLPPGKGLVGEAVTTGKPIIANDAKRRKEWFDKTDIQTGFDTQDLMVVPMQVQDRVIGVIEVINKADGVPFNQSDQELLTTFSSQATIAIENARLYTLTDQALAARVEELSVMQRIDRDLNASLDVNQAIHITLNWAMRQSKADAGLVGIVEETGVLIMVFRGYDNELAAYSTEGISKEETVHLPLDLPGIRNAIQTSQLHFSSYQDQATENNPGAQEIDQGLLKGASWQTVVPIRREDHVIGLLLLEGRRDEDFSVELKGFLSRLSDHAAIAISNAQLYAEVKAANLAKSKFVSFVAHELKNPMASIKGYTELVAGGMAGPVNEMQSSFLATVRSNVDRMNTIVSDLNDLTKIEVGSLRLEYKAVQVKDILDDVIRSLRRQVEEKEQQLSLNLPEELPPVWVDPFRLGQILTNLLSNANKYTYSGGQIRVGAERIIEDVLPSRLESVHLWVQDTGIGINKEDQEHIFELYFRTEISKETATGTGLGLSISKRLVEMQGGRMWFESEPVKGSTFHFTLPVAEVV